jgi:hypothetical protein
MLFKSPIFSQASGSIGGTTFSHNRGGMYTRNRVIPTDPGSSYQQAIRSAMATLAAWWSQTLTAQQRIDWRLYASSTAMTNRLGDSVFLTGQQHFIRANVPRLQAGIAVVEDAPVVFNLGSYTLPTFGTVDGSPSFEIAYTNTDAWAATDDGYMLVYGSPPQSAGRNFFKGPWRYLGKLDGDTASPPTSPEDFGSAYPWTLTPGLLVWAQIRFIQPDGRLSSGVIIGPEAISV